MANRIVAGLIAGAAGAIAHDVTGYLDMLARGRPRSRLAAETAARMADEMGLPLDFDVEDEDEETDGPGGELVANRQEALGALVGYATRMGIGAGYGAARLILPRAPAWVAGTALGALSMAASDVPAARLGVADAGRWGRMDRAAQVIPHMAYGLVAALTFEAAKS